MGDLARKMKMTRSPLALLLSRSREKVARASARDEGRRAKRDGEPISKPRTDDAVLIRPSGTFSRQAGEGK